LVSASFEEDGGDDDDCYYRSVVIIIFIIIYTTTTTTTIIITIMMIIIIIITIICCRKLNSRITFVKKRVLCLYDMIILESMGEDNVDGMEIRYELDRPGIESRWA